jgi:hypothetical protein
VHEQYVCDDWREAKPTRHLRVLRTVGVRVTNKHRLPVVIELAVGHCNTGDSMRDIEKAVVVILLLHYTFSWH